MKILIAILSCHKYQKRRQAQRETWLGALKGADYRFFLGGSTEQSWEPDEVYLSCPDDYARLCQKSKAVMRWASSAAYDFAFKCDDDTFLLPERLLASGFEQHDYSGFTESGWDLTHPYCFARGGSGYWLRKPAVEIIAAHMIEKRHCEDVAVGETLARYGISPVHDERYRHEEKQIYREAQLGDPSLISLHKCDPAQMRAAYLQVSKVSAQLVG